MVVDKQYCETLRILRNMNFNVPLSYNENYWRDTSIVFNLGINTTLSRSAVKIVRSFVRQRKKANTT